VDSFEGFDTSHWKTTDKAWTAERKLQWLQIEPLLYLLDKNKQARAIIQQYFLKGTLPQWQKLHDWGQNSRSRHLDLMLFLYLHPSKDDAVLRPLRDKFMDNPHALPADRLAGFSKLCLGTGYVTACSGGTHRFLQSELEKQIPQSVPYLAQAPEPRTDCKVIVAHTDDSNERLFNLMWPQDVTQHHVRLPVTRNTFFNRAPRYPVDFEEFPLLPRPLDLDQLWTISQWLASPTALAPGARDMLFQYERPLEVWYHYCAQEEVSHKAAWRELLLIAVYRIYHFPRQENDGDDPRVRFVTRIQALFAGREFSASFQALLKVVQDGEAVIEEAWTDDARVVSPAFYTGSGG
jgi:hypothetical protein